MAETTFSRKLDSMGRIMIPIKLREALNMEIGREYEFSIMEKDGKRFVLIDCGSIDCNRTALEVAKKKGLKIRK